MRLGLNTVLRLLQIYFSYPLFFSSFSVSSYMNEEGRLSDTNLRSETFADVSTECSSRRLW